MTLPNASSCTSRRRVGRDVDLPFGDILAVMAAGVIRKTWITPVAGVRSGRWWSEKFAGAWRVRYQFTAVISGLGSCEGEPGIYSYFGGFAYAKKSARKTRK